MGGVALRRVAGTGTMDSADVGRDFRGHPGRFSGGNAVIFASSVKGPPFRFISLI